MSYIVVEGLDYTGKSTLVEQLGEIYKSRLVSEPFSESLASSKIRELIRSATHESTYETQLLIASRIEMFSKLNEYIRHNSPTYLISDRSFVTNMVYQGNDKKTMSRIMKLNIDTLAAYGYDIIPDILIYIEVPYSVALERFNQRQESNNLDKKVMNEKTYNEMQKRYHDALTLLTSNSKRTKVIKVSHESTVKNICYLIDDRMKLVDSIKVKKYEEALPA